LRSSFTGKSILIDIPPSFGQTAGFHLGRSTVPSAHDERYRLTRLEIRKPAQAYSGLGQALSHVMEMVLIHKEENNNRWANVILPFQVSTNGGDFDIINPLVDGVKLPTRIFESGYVMASAVSELRLSPAFENNATFSEFWATAPAAGCPNKNVNVRYLMRTNTLALGVDTFAQLSNALEFAPEQEPVQPPETSWIMGTCKNATGVGASNTTCTMLKADNMTHKLEDLKNYQSIAVKEQRARKATLDKVLGQLKEHIGPATPQSIALYETSVASYNSLKAAAEQLASSQSSVAKTGAFAEEADKALFDREAPHAFNGTETAPLSIAAQPGDVLHGPARGNPTSTTKAAMFMDISAAKQVKQRNDCSALGQSPVDIATKTVVDSSALPRDLVEPLAFRYMSLAGHSEGRLHVSHHEHHIRVAVPPGSVEWPLGGVLSGGVLRGVSYVDIHVPGEHSVDGRVPAAELQLVHESAPGKPAMAVAVPLELGDDQDNAWLQPLLRALPEKNSAKELLGQPLALLHEALSSGQTSSYYRYDGSLTKPPCLLTQWFVLEKPGFISQKQLADLGAALGIDVSSPDTQPLGPSFVSSLVMRGSPQLMTQVAGIADEGSLGARPVTLLARRRVQI
jgi:carbonic anhydrase